MSEGLLGVSYTIRRMSKLLTEREDEVSSARRGSAVKGEALHHYTLLVSHV